MKIMFTPVYSNSFNAEIIGEIIAGFDLSAFPNGATFIGNDETRDAGIRNVERLNGEIFAVLGQSCLAYECQSIDGSHDWSGTGEWINANDYNPDHCYIVATSAPEGAEYVKRANGWTVKVPEPAVTEEPVK